jgi:hypothetical protein
VGFVIDVPAELMVAATRPLWQNPSYIEGFPTIPLGIFGGKERKRKRGLVTATAGQPFSSLWFPVNQSSLYS